MLCNQLTQVSQALVQLSPRPSMAEVARLVCNCCEKTVSCPVLTIDQVEALDRQRDGSQTAADGH